MMNRILSLIGWLGTAMVFVAVAIRFGYPAKEQWAFYLAWGGLVCVLAYTLGQWREIAKVFSRRQARYGTLMGVSILVVLAILVAINYIGSKQNKRWDLTANKQFSLSDQSRNVAAKLDAPLQVQVFAQEPQFPRFQEKMKEYEYASSKISTEYIDPEKKPSVAKQNNIDRMPTIVFNYKGRSERVNSTATGMSTSWSRTRFRERRDSSRSGRTAATADRRFQRFTLTVRRRVWFRSRPI